MAGNLNALIFQSFQDKFIGRCYTLFIEAYNTSVSNKSIFLDFEENDITAILHNYIDENPKRIKWEISTNREDNLFDKNIIQKKGFAAKSARIDMKYSTFWKEDEIKYYVEAKNLKSKDSGLKRRYITTGIDNFLSGGKYSNCDGFLVGYILEGTIEKCTEGINKLLKKDGRETETINKRKPSLLIESHYSRHQEKEISHLFFNYVDPHLDKLKSLEI
jgi:hypothetical protein